MKLATRLALSFTALLMALILCSGMATIYSTADLFGDEHRYYNRLFAIELSKLADGEDFDQALKEELRRRRLAYIKVQKPSGELLEAVDPEARPVKLTAVDVTLNGYQISLANSRARLEEEALEAAGRQLAVAVPLSLLVWLLGLYGLRRLAQPFKVLEKETARLSQFDEDFAQKSSPELLLLAKKMDDAGELARSFLSMESQLQNTITELQESTATRERLETELRVGRELQQAMLPKPIVPNEGFQLATCLRPAQEMSGDLFHHFWVDGKLLLAVGDVSGKGVSAAMLMAVAQTLIRHALRECGTLAEAVSLVNNRMCEDNPMSYFLTLFIALFNPEDGSVEYVNAGHPRPFVLEKTGAVRTLDGGRGMGLGVIEGQTFESATETLGVGETLLAFTDGVTEATNARGELFAPCLADALQSVSGDPESIVQTLLKDVRSFEGENPPTDDLTLLVLKRC